MSLTNNRTQDSRKQNVREHQNLNIELESTKLIRSNPREDGRGTNPREMAVVER
jgi:hypothetical protein